jgi:hypothetical protein
MVSKKAIRESNRKLPRIVFKKNLSGYLFRVEPRPKGFFVDGLHLSIIPEMRSKSPHYGPLFLQADSENATIGAEEQQIAD